MQPQSLTNLLRKCAFLLVLFTLTSNLSAATITWIGGTGDWADRSNWDSGNVPNARDEVIIPSGTVYIVNFEAKCKSIHITSGSTLYIEDDGGLYMETDESCILNDGTLTNDGYMHLENINGQTNQQHYGVYNTHEFYQNGQLLLAGDFHYGIQNAANANVTNTAMINGFDLRLHAVENKGSFINTSSGIIASEGTRNFANRSPGTMNNFGTLEARSVDVGSSGAVSNSSTFTNESSGLIDFYNISGTANCLSNFNNGIFTNKGSIVALHTFVSKVIGANANGLFNNNVGASIHIEDTQSIGLSVGGTFRNRGNLSIEDCPSDAIYIINGFMVNHQRGTITINDINMGIHIDSGSGELRNYGTTIISNSTGHSIFNKRQFANRPMGKLIIDDIIYLFSGSNMINQGHLMSRVSGASHILLGTFTNHGALGDVHDRFSGINNLSIRVRPFSGTVQQGIPVNNALDVGGTSYVTVMDWYTTESGSTIAGTYDAVNNTFTPNANAVGLTEIYVRIRINTGGITRRHKVLIPGGVQSGSSARTNTDATSHSNQKIGKYNWTVYPNPTAEVLNLQFDGVDFSDEKISVTISNSLGQIVLSHTYSFDVNNIQVALPATISNGTYWLSVHTPDQAPKNQMIIVDKSSR